MVRLYEHQGKELLKNLGIPIPQSSVASSPQEAYDYVKKLGRPVVVKTQIWATGRGKAGGIKFADNPEEASKVTGNLIGSKINGFTVEKVLVEEKLDIVKEYYVGIIVDDSYLVKSPMIIFSTKGGVDLEEVAQKSPEKIARITVDILEGLNADGVNSALKDLKIKKEDAEKLSKVIGKMYEVFRKYDCRAAEINPLVKTRNGDIIAADCRITIDDSSVPRHPELGITVARDSDVPPTELEKLAWTIEESDYRGIGFFAQLESDVPSEGYVGYHGIGGGGAILGVDALARHNLNIADYADTSGNPTASKVYRVIKIILSQKNIEGYFLAGFCVANQEQWHHAHGIVKALREDLMDREGFPVVLVIAGNKEEEAIEILKEGLSDLPIRLEIYGREHVYDTDFVAGRMRELVMEYRKERGN